MFIIVRASAFNFQVSIRLPMVSHGGKSGFSRQDHTMLCFYLHSCLQVLSGQQYLVYSRGIFISLQQVRIRLSSIFTNTQIEYYSNEFNKKVSYSKGEVWSNEFDLGTKKNFELFFSVGRRFTWWTLLMPWVYVPAAGDGYSYLSVNEAFGSGSFSLASWIDGNVRNRRGGEEEHLV